MTLFKNKYRVESARLKWWDYSSDGAYFVTICVKYGECVFGDVKNYIMRLNELGCVVCQEWLKTSEIRQNVVLDQWVVMPNHVHGIVILEKTLVCGRVETRRGASLPKQPINQFGSLIPDSLQSVINHFKGAVKRWANKNGYSDFTWQPRFYDHIIRNESDLNRIRKYIYDNPKKWELDRNNSVNLWM